MTKARDIASATTPNANAALLATFPHRNLIINGAMQLWQRGLTQTSTGYGCVDRWRNTVSGTTTFTQDTSNLPTGFEYALRWTTGASSSYGQLRQFLETSTVKILRGRPLTASAYIKVSGSYSGSVTWEIAYSTTSDVNAGNTWVQLTETNVVAASASDASSDYKRISCNVTIPSNAVGLYIGIVPSATQASGEWVSVTGVQLEVGETATPFEHRSFGDELARCQRYYWQLSSTVHGNYPSWIATAYSTTQMNIQIPFPVTMRSTPTMTYNTGNVNYYRFYRNSSNHNFGTVGTDTVTSEHINMYGSATSSHTAGTSGTLQIRLADGAGVFASAEL